VLAERASRDPQGIFVVLEDGSAWSNQDMLDRVRETARRLQTIGLVSGERLLLWLPNGPELLRYLLAAWALALTPVPINVALRGSPLGRVLDVADTPVMVCHARLLARLDELTPDRISRFSSIVVIDGLERAATAALSPLRTESSIPSDSPVPQFMLRQPWDVAAILFSSGTTGAAKGVMTPFAQLWSLGRVFYGLLERNDRMLLMYPLFHVAALGALFGTLAAGATFALTESFRASEFFDVVRRTGATSAPGLGRTFIDVLNKLPRRPDDADNPFRIINVQSVNAAVREFSERFGCEVFATYSMTETSGVCVGVPSAIKDGSIGRPRSGIEVRLVDEHDIEVPVGEAGEVILRAELPWVLNSGYFQDAKQTAEAWRNGWFHTGDVARQDSDGDLFFLDRSNDVIRRRSENISSIEIEAEVRQWPQVQDAAAVGVETAAGEEEILLIVAPMPETAIDPTELLRFLIARLPHFMVPRFVRIVRELPKTQTNRVQKSELRKAGITPDCWDREAAGIRVRRDRL
jgi:crotonobetaine/carnitine-CoA ligase